MSLSRPVAGLATKTMLTYAQALKHITTRALSTRNPLLRPFVNIHVPPSLKWAIAILFLLNIKSWPLFWTFRVLRPVIRVILRDIRYHLRFRVLNSFSSRSGTEEMEEHWIDNVPLIGMNPFDFRNVYHGRATIDDCDFNLHLSNSSYAKALDGSRFECLVTLFPVFLRSGGSMALGASHFKFIKEIPPFQKFEIRSYIGAWDRKWLYLVSKFVSQPKRKKPHSTETTATASTTNNNSNNSHLSLTDPEPDGSTLHTIAIVQLCFKAGRITVPPTVILASNGFTSESGRSRSNPPTQWTRHVKSLFSPRHGGSQKKYIEFVKSGWKEVAAVRVESDHGAGEQQQGGRGTRWWEEALSGDVVESQRLAGLHELEKLWKGLQAAKRT